MKPEQTRLRMARSLLETGTLVVSSADSMVFLGVGSEYSVQIADDVLS